MVNDCPNQSATMGIKRARTVATVVVGFCMASFMLDIFSLSHSSSPSLRRSLQSSPPAIYEWAKNHLRPIETAPEPSKEVSVFWHVPKSGGNALKSIYECMGRAIANRAGADPRYGHDEDEEIVVFSPYPGVSKASYVNVDTATRPGMDRAKRLGLVPSGLVDMIITSDPVYAIENLFDTHHKGRLLALFRHPVDRLVSKFYYLREASWEEQYRPQWKRLSVLQWAKTRNTDVDHVVKKLAGLRADEVATDEHLRVAKTTIKKRFVVGLMDRMEESVHRFNVVMGIDESDEGNRKCMDHFFHNSIGAKRHNSGSYPKVERDGAVWNAIVKRNALDIKLYDFIVKLFDEQEGIIGSYASAARS